MHKYEEQGESDCSADGACIGYAPCYAGQEEEEREEVGEGGVGAVVGVFCFCDFLETWFEG